MMRLRRLTALGLSAALMVAPVASSNVWAAPPSADDPAAETERLYREGVLHYETADYPQAVESFKKAFALAGSIADEGLRVQIQRTLLYNMAQSQVKAYELDKDPARLRHAKGALERYLELEPDESSRNDATGLLVGITADLERLGPDATKPPEPEPAKPDPEPTKPDPEPTKPDPEPSPEPTKPDSEPTSPSETEAPPDPEPPDLSRRDLQTRNFDDQWDLKKRNNGIILMAVGAVAAAGGGVLMWHGNRFDDNALDQVDEAHADEEPGWFPTSEERDFLQKQRQTGNIVIVSGIGALALGGVAIITGGVLVGLAKPKKKKEARVRASPMMGARGGGVSLSGRF